MEPLQLQKQISTRTAEEPNRNEPIRGSLPSFWNRCESMRTTGTLDLWLVLNGFDPHNPTFMLCHAIQDFCGEGWSSLPLRL